jgi:predicted metal-binding protein
MSAEVYAQHNEMKYTYTQALLLGSIGKCETCNGNLTLKAYDDKTGNGTIVCVQCKKSQGRYTKPEGTHVSKRHRSSHSHTAI